VFLSASGKAKCTNKGCQKEFELAENDEHACKYHPGDPMFSNLKKFWTCCKKEAYDWDDFMKLPLCTVGKHNPKLV
jgi:hypothetical protein